MTLNTEVGNDWKDIFPELVNISAPAFVSPIFIRMNGKFCCN